VFLHVLGGNIMMYNYLRQLRAPKHFSSGVLTCLRW